MNIPAIPSTTKQAKDSMDKALARATSLNEDLLSQRPGLRTKADLCVELKKLEQCAPSLGSLMVNPEKFSKAAKAKKLVSVRTIEFSKVPMAKAEIEESVQNAFVTMTTMETRTVLHIQRLHFLGK
jgi:hypothetical protein